MSLSRIKLQVLANRFINECDGHAQSLVFRKMYDTFNKHEQSKQWNTNLFNFICNSHANEAIINEMLCILSDVNDVNDSISHSNPCTSLHLSSDTSIFDLSTDILLHCTQFLRLTDLFSLQQCCRYLLIECNRPNALYYLDWQTDRYHSSQHLSHHRFSQIQKLQIDHFDYNDYSIQPFHDEPLLVQKGDIHCNINSGWFGFVKHLRINVVNEDYFPSSAHHLMHYQTLCDTLSVFYNVTTFIYANGRLDKSLTYHFKKIINPIHIRHLDVSSVRFDDKLVTSVLMCRQVESLILSDIGMDLHYQHCHRDIVLPNLQLLNVESVDDIEHQLDDQSLCHVYYSFLAKIIANSNHKVKFVFETARTQLIPMHVLFASPGGIGNIGHLFFDGQLSAAHQLLSAIAIKLNSNECIDWQLGELTMSFETECDWRSEFDIEQQSASIDRFIEKWFEIAAHTTNECSKKLIWTVYEDNVESYKWNLLAYFVKRWYQFVSRNRSKYQNCMSFAFQVWNRKKFIQTIAALNAHNRLNVDWSEEPQNDIATITLNCM
eukprot:233647_1